MFGALSGSIVNALYRVAQPSLPATPLGFRLKVPHLRNAPRLGMAPHASNPSIWERERPIAVVSVS